MSKPTQSGESNPLRQTVCEIQKARDSRQGAPMPLVSTIIDSYKQDMDTYLDPEDKSGVIFPTLLTRSPLNDRKSYSRIIRRSAGNENDKPTPSQLPCLETIYNSPSVLCLKMLSTEVDMNFDELVLGPTRKSPTNLSFLMQVIKTCLPTTDIDSEQQWKTRISDVGGPVIYWLGCIDGTAFYQQELVMTRLKDTEMLLSKYMNTLTNSVSSLNKSIEFWPRALLKVDELNKRHEERQAILDESIKDLRIQTEKIEICADQIRGELSVPKGYIRFHKKKDDDQSSLQTVTTTTDTISEAKNQLACQLLGFMISNSDEKEEFKNMLVERGKDNSSNRPINDSVFDKLSSSNTGVVLLYLHYVHGIPAKWSIPLMKQKKIITQLDLLDLIVELTRKFVINK